jgi:hypothetical protein
MVVRVSQTEVENFIAVQVVGAAVEAEIYCFFAVVAGLIGLARVARVARVAGVWAVCVAILKKLVANLSGIFSGRIVLVPQVVEALVGSNLALLWIKRGLGVSWIIGVTRISGVARVAGITGLAAVVGE